MRKTAMSSRKPPFWVVLKAHAKADPRKTGVLIALSVVMVAVYVWMFWTPPRTSEASTAANLVVAPASVAVTGKPAESSQSTTARARQELPQPLRRNLTRDPFAVDLSRFPGSSETQPASGTSVTYSADPVKTIQDLAKELELQSTICGKKPLAHINGRVVQPGEDIAGFTLERVEPQRVILQRDGIRVALHMK